MFVQLDEDVRVHSRVVHLRFTQRPVIPVRTLLELADFLSQKPLHHKVQRVLVLSRVDHLHALLNLQMIIQILNN